MVKISLEYQGDLHCLATHGPSGSTLATDAPVDNQGRGESFSPTDLVATALGACMLTVMGIAARRLNLDLRGAHCVVEKEMSADTPRRIATLITHLWLPIPSSADPDGVLERTALACPVHHSLHPAIARPVVFHWKE